MIAIIGAGISGLSLAYQLQKKRIPYILLDSNSQPGGCIKTVTEKDYILDLGPSALMADDTQMEFLWDLNLEDDIVIPSSTSKNRFVFKEGKIKELPSGPVSFLFGDFFNFETKISLLKEMNRKPEKKAKEETIGDFFERRFNKEIVDYAVTPFVSGIFAGDPYKLLLDKTFPFLSDYENKYGSVIKGFIKSKKNGQRRQTLSFKGGMQMLPMAIAHQLENILLDCKVQEFSKEGSAYKIKYTYNDRSFEFCADQVVLSLPSYGAAKVVKGLYPELSEELNKIHYAPLVKVFLAYKKNQIKDSLNGYGVLNPICEEQFCTGVMWTSSVYSNVCPEDEVLLTAMVGGDVKSANAKLSEEEILNNVIKEVGENYHIKGKPVYTYVHKIENAIPQYDINIINLDWKLKEYEKEGLYVSANWKGGVSLSECLKKGKVFSEKVLVPA